MRNCEPLPSCGKPQYGERLLILLDFQKRANELHLPRCMDCNPKACVMESGLSAAIGSWFAKVPLKPSFPHVG